MTAADCAALGEETYWYPGESCDGPVPFECDAPTYCDAAGGAQDEHIARVQLGDIDNSSGQDYYADYTDLYTYLAHGTDHTITVTNGEYWDTDITTVWIDWNQDKDFYDAGEQVLSGDPDGPVYSGPFQVDAGALEGPTRMRVRIQYGGTPDPCGTTTYGEVEDYTVIIGPPPPYGACCVGADCFWAEDMDEAACTDLGGAYQGDGTDCSPNPCVGACCWPDGTCSDGLEEECVGGEYQGDGTACAATDCPQPPPQCPPDSLYAALPYLPEDPWALGVSDTAFPYVRVENFMGVSGDICDVHWWGGQLDASLVNCDRNPDTYEIKFFLDDDGVPGDQICDTYTVTPLRTFTGLLYHTTYQVHLYRFEVELLTPCCPVPPNAWISIVGVGDPLCRMWWVSTPTGDGAHCGGADFSSLACGPPDNDYDFAMCLTGEYVERYGACCQDSVICGDFDNDGDVDGDDYWVIAGAIPSCDGDPDYVAAADLDRDNCITLQDYSEWLLCYQGWTVDTCEDNVEAQACYAVGGRFEADTLCTDLDPPCGRPGACCDDVIGECLEDVNEANCDGRFILGGTCDDFDPPCGPIPMCPILYAPSEDDKPSFRAAISAITGDRCDYFDARVATPDLDLLASYDCVFTWANFAYDDYLLFGDNLADYVDQGGRVILGQWAFDGFSSTPSMPPARILEPEYCPVEVTVVGSGAYNGDGVDCVHSSVDAYSSDYLDICTLRPGSWSDGTMTTGSLAVAWRPDRHVYYSPGNTGGTYSTGDWAQLTANMCMCPSYSLGACCDPTTGFCDDDVLLLHCMPPLQFFPDLQCAELEPECGNPGCCCEEPEEGVVKDPVESLELNCNGRFLPGVTGAECVAAAFEPECGLYDACEHSITMWDDYGDGWNDGYIDVYVNGELALAGVTLGSGSGPETVTFPAATDDTIETIWTPGGWPYEASYCIYDVLGTELGCDGLDGIDPTGITVTGFCGGEGACCDIYTGVCEDEITAVVCLEQGKEPHPGQQCAELNPLCGDPGACCNDETGDCVDDVYAANCGGRHVVGQPCDPDPFDPPCGWPFPTGLLYAPTEDDNLTFRAELSAILGQRVDYYDARAGTPTLELMSHYRAVMTWVNYPYDDDLLMGDRLADYVDVGGRVILGQWTEYSGQMNWLEGRIMEPGYCPVDATSVSSGSYSGDGVDCVHILGPVLTYSSYYLDVCTLLPSNWSDGTMTTGSLAVAGRFDRGVYYSPGNTGGTYGSGDWAQLTANMLICGYSPPMGACCYPDVYADAANPWLGGLCEDWVDLFDCWSSGGELYSLEFCDDLDPICGNPGACCIDNPPGGTDPPGECTIELEELCSGRFLPGVECDPDPFDPPCGEGLSYDNIGAELGYDGEGGAEPIGTTVGGRNAAAHLQ
jgi:hypothetical protein